MDTTRPVRRARLVVESIFPRAPYSRREARPTPMSMQITPSASTPNTPSALRMGATSALIESSAGPLTQDDLNMLHSCTAISNGPMGAKESPCRRSPSTSLRRGIYNEHRGCRQTFSRQQSR